MVRPAARLPRALPQVHLLRLAQAHAGASHLHRVADEAAGRVDAIDFYVARRQLGWAGHVRRMDFDRLPRRMLSSWVPHKRPPGAPRMTCPHTQRWCERVHGVSAQPCCARLEVSSAAHHEE